MQCNEKTSESLEQEVVRLQNRIAELEEKEKFYQIAEKQYRDLVESTLVGMFKTTLAGDILYANQALVEMFGFESPEEFGTQLVFARYKRAEDREEFLAFIKTKGVVNNFEVELITKTGRPKPVLINAVLADNIISGMMIDITDHKRAEEALRNSEEELRHIVEGSPIPTFVIDTDHMVKHWNKACEKLTGLSAEEMVETKQQWKAFSPTERSMLADLIVDGLPEEEIIKRSGRAYRRSAIIDGAYEAEDFVHGLGENGRWVSFSAAPLKDVAGTITGAIEILQDVTERKHATKALQHSEQMFRTLAETAPFGISIMNSEQRFEYFNPKFTEIFGYTFEDVTDNATWFKKAYPDKEYRENVITIWKEDLGDEPEVGAKRERIYNVRCKDGRDRVIHFRGIALEDGRHFVTYEDITIRAQAERDLKESELKYRALFESTPDAIMLTDSGGFLDCNKATLEMFGCSAKEEFTIKHPGELSPPIQPDGEESIFAANKHIKEALAKGFCFFEWVHRRIDGGDFPAEVLLSTLELRGRMVLQALVRDITDRKRAEEAVRRAQDELEQRVRERTAELTDVNQRLQQEVEERKRAEISLQQSEERYRYIFDNALVSLREEDISELRSALDELRRKGVRNFREYLDEHPEFISRAIKMIKITDTNDAAMRLYEADDRGQFSEREKMFVPGELSGFHESLIALAEGQTSFEGESVNQTFRGKPINILLKIAFPSKKSRFNKALVSVVDITERKRAEEALQESENRFSTFMDHLPGIVCMRDEAGRVTYLNRYMGDTFGEQASTLAERVTGEWSDFSRENIRESTEAVFDKNEKSHFYRTFRFPVVRKGKPTIYGGIGIDITKQVEAEEALRKAHGDLEETVKRRTAELVTINEQLKQEVVAHKHTGKALEEQTLLNEMILQTTMNGLFIKDLDGNILKANPAASMITGYRQEELIKMNILDIEPLDSLAAFKQRSQLAVEKGFNRFEAKSRHKDDHIADVEVSQNFLKIGEQELLISFFNDITKRKQAERVLKEREEELEVKSSNLEEVNTALMVLLRRRDEDKRELEDKVLVNMKELALPYIEKIGQGNLDARQRSYLEILESNLDDIISPFARTLSSKYLNLTPTEIQVANLIKQGKTSKEIAELWNLSSRTVEFHRDNIRRKLQIKNRKTNLRSYLLSLQ
ncbi:MAG: PAS domain S-box protein [Deltaproteobacteria bacterium]|nr:PAS domain S-box protein [Deltaproteobacteria bacterium]